MFSATNSNRAGRTGPTIAKSYWPSTRFAAYPAAIPASVPTAAPTPRRAIVPRGPGRPSSAASRASTGAAAWARVESAFRAHARRSTSSATGGAATSPNPA